MPCYSFNHGGRDATGISRDGRRSTGRRLSKDNAVTIIPRWDEHHTRVEHKRHELRLLLRHILVESRNDGHPRPPITVRRCDAADRQRCRDPFGAKHFYRTYSNGSTLLVPRGAHKKHAERSPRLRALDIGCGRHMIQIRPEWRDAYACSRRPTVLNSAR